MKSLRLHLRMRFPSIRDSTREVLRVNDRHERVLERVAAFGHLGTNGVVVARVLLPFVAPVREVRPVADQASARFVAAAEVVVQGPNAVELDGPTDDIGELARSIHWRTPLF